MGTPIVGVLLFRVTQFATHAAEYLANIKSKQFAAEQQFNQGSIDTTYMKTKKLPNQVWFELTLVEGKIF